MSTYSEPSSLIGSSLSLLIDSAPELDRDDAD